MSLARYHDGQRELQDRFETRRLADRLDEVTYAAALGEGHRLLIERADMFFLATADAQGQPDCSFKGGAPGFVRVLAPDALAWADEDGNGQFRSLGNILRNPHVGLLFVDWQKPSRLRVNGLASVLLDDPLLAEYPGAKSIVRLAIEQVFPNCPRYLPRMQQTDASPYWRTSGATAPRPGWKDDPRFRDALPESDR